MSIITSQSRFGTRILEICIRYAIHLINKNFSKTFSLKSPYELLSNNKPSYIHLRTFGCLCYPYTCPYNSKKLEPRSILCIFIGYPSPHKGYWYIDKATKLIYVIPCIVFHEIVSPFLSMNQKPIPSSITTTSSFLSFVNIPVSQSSYNVFGESHCYSPNSEMLLSPIMPPWPLLSTSSSHFSHYSSSYTYKSINNSLFQFVSFLTYYFTSG